MTKTRDQLLAEAAVLEAKACINDQYMQAMERTSERTGGRLGHLNNPSLYHSHRLSAARKRKHAADLRAQAATC